MSTPPVWASGSHRRRVWRRARLSLLDRCAALHYDNAVMEAFFSSLKSEVADRFDSCGTAKRELFDYIEVFYNQRRRHSTIGYVSPAVFERQTVIRREATTIEPVLRAGILPPSPAHDQRSWSIL